MTAPVHILCWVVRTQVWDRFIAVAASLFEDNTVSFGQLMCDYEDMYRMLLRSVRHSRIEPGIDTRASAEVEIEEYTKGKGVEFVANPPVFERL